MLVNCRMGADAAMAPCATQGYLIRNHDDSMPPYDLVGLGWWWWWWWNTLLS